MPTLTEERKFSGFFKSRGTNFALLFPWPARCWIRLLLTEIKAIPERAKNPLSSVSTKMTSISTFLILIPKLLNKYREQ
jgi:hypothetical protein